MRRWRTVTHFLVLFMKTCRGFTNITILELVFPDFEEGEIDLVSEIVIN